MSAVKNEESEQKNLRRGRGTLRKDKYLARALQGARRESQANKQAGGGIPSI
jgi:hypothetical protein